MQSPTTRPGRTGQPPRLSRDAIVVAAQRVLDEEGAERLSMRRLARELSSTPMALYRHVLDKDELLMLLLDANIQRIDPSVRPEHPRDRLVSGVGALCDVLEGCPWGVEVAASDKFVSAALMRIVEAVVEALADCGVPPSDVVYAYRVIWAYLVGERVARGGSEPSEGRRRGLEAVIDGLLGQGADRIL
ncbi:TetR/AcrR family transcriptional regulator [Streptomyces californicus]|uniref:TetR/AcrR family transcriptional regulator n=1 Tax=Streptomyces californicus TaxID=67351 RepID=UPI0037A8A004